MKGYVKANTIASRLNRQYKRSNFDPYLVAEWCAQVEVEKVRDLDIMWKFLAVPLTVGFEKMVLLPCNVYKIIELYNESETFLEYNRTETHLTNIKDMFNQEEVKEDDTIYISFYGVPVDKETGEILIPSGHQSMCEEYCKMQKFEEDVAYGQFDKDMYFHFSNKFSGLLRAARSSYRHMDRGTRLRREILNGDMLPMIGRLPIKSEEID